MSDRRVSRALSLTQLAVMVALVWLFIVGAVIQQHPGRLERVHPHTQTVRPATPQEAKAAELHRQLEQWRAELEQR